MIKKKQLLLFVLVLLLFSSASTKAKASRTSHPFSSSFGEPENHVLVGKIPQKQTFLSIGIPTVWRGERGAEYVVKTLHSLVAHSSEAERKEMVVFVLLADKTENLQKKVAVAITSDFSLEIRNGLIVLVQTPSNLYDRLLFTPNDFNDDYERVLWRQKQSVDFSFLFSFVDGISRFYLQLEDDVVTTEGYFSAMKSFMLEHQHGLSFSFSPLGFIGKAFPNKELKALSSLFHLYFRDNPVDFSLEYHKAMRNCKSCHLTRSAPLFQHIGMRSSLKGKTQDIIDNEFERKEDMKTLGGKDIPIVVASSAVSKEHTLPSDAYSKAPGGFKCIVRNGDSFMAALTAPAVLNEMIVEFICEGSGDHLFRPLEDVVFEVGVCEEDIGDCSVISNIAPQPAPSPAHAIKLNVPLALAGSGYAITETLRTSYVSMHFLVTAAATITVKEIAVFK
eukprot:m.225419 g.225419  ORF g.225419 m.225419 type:complete len:448 (-) comp13860_c0_seq12:2685-4028(-)